MGHSTVDDVKARAAAAEERVQRAEAKLSREQVSVSTALLAAHRGCCSEQSICQRLEQHHWQVVQCSVDHKVQRSVRTSG